MGECILSRRGGGGGTTGELPPQVTSLTLIAGDAKIDVSFKGVAAEYLPLVKNYRVVYKENAIPQKPSDGQYVEVQAGTAGSVTKSTTLTGLKNDVRYGVRVFIRGTNGWQTSPEPQGYATPQAGMSLAVLPSGTIVKINENGVGANYIKIQGANPASSIYDSSCSGQWLIRQTIYESGYFDTSGSNDYENSEANRWLNNDFINIFSQSIKSHIKQVKIPYYKKNGVLQKLNNGLSCKAFYLSAVELGFEYSQFDSGDGFNLQYFDKGNGESAKNKRKTTFKGSPYPWDTRTPRKNNASDIVKCEKDGGFYLFSVSASSGKRPTFIVDDLRVSVSPNPDGSYSAIE